MISGTFTVLLVTMTTLATMFLASKMLIEFKLGRKADGIIRVLLKCGLAVMCQQNASCSLYCNALTPVAGLVGTSHHDSSIDETLDRPNRRLCCELRPRHVTCCHEVRKASCWMVLMSSVVPM